MEGSTLYSKRIGEERFNNAGLKMRIVEYNSPLDIEVVFEGGRSIKCTYGNFCKGSVKNPYFKKVYGVGFIGEGVYSTSINNVMTKQYKTWAGMLGRCYNKKRQAERPTYVGCTVDERWHNFQNFAAWYDENYYEVLGEKMSLDKDILVKGNKIYGPETCVFVISSMNSLFINNKKIRGGFAPRCQFL